MNRLIAAAALVLGGVGVYLLARNSEASYLLDFSGGDAGGGWGDAAGWDWSAASVPVFEPVQPDRSYEDMIISAGGASRGDQNLAAFLMMIRAAEGTDGPRGYQTMFGYRYFDSFEDHPRQRFAFKQTDGKTNYTTAAGAYQFLSSTWDKLRAKLGLPDFSPASQDAAAVELIRERGALADVVAGRFEAAVAKLGTIWASLPSSRYPQGKRSMEFVQKAYQQAGGVYA